MGIDEGQQVVGVRWIIGTVSVRRLVLADVTAIDVYIS